VTFISPTPFNCRRRSTCRVNAFPQLLVGDVQIPLRRLDVGVSEHRLDDADIDAVGEQPAGALVSQIVPVQIELPQLLASTRAPGLARFRNRPDRNQSHERPSGVRLGAQNQLGVA
jgi:hypothetical protein